MVLSSQMRWNNPFPFWWQTKAFCPQQISCHIPKLCIVPGVAKAFGLIPQGLELRGCILPADGRRLLEFILHVGQNVLGHLERKFTSICPWLHIKVKALGLSMCQRKQRAHQHTHDFLNRDSGCFLATWFHENVSYLENLHR